MSKNRKIDCGISNYPISKNRNVVVTKSMLFQLNVGQKDVTVS